jgi:hypothetical protein
MDDPSAKWVSSLLLLRLQLGTKLHQLAYDVHATANLQLKAQLLERDMLHRQKVLDSFMHRKLVA